MNWLTYVLSLDWAAVALRLALGVIFLVHGYPKLKDMQGTSGFLAGLGFKPGMLWAIILGVTEFAGGLALILGLFMRLAAGLLIISMAIATLLKIFKWKTPFSGDQVGWEFDLLIIAVLVALILIGSGSVSLDHFLLPEISPIIPM